MDWYGVSFPTIGQLESAAEKHGVCVAYHYDFDVPRIWWHTTGEPWFIGVPRQFGNLARCWAVAHELGHLQLHDGPSTKEAWAIGEREANHWAARALVPDQWLGLFGGSADLGTIIDCLSRNYQPIGNHSSKLHGLARRIAYTRLEAMRKMA